MVTEQAAEAAIGHPEESAGFIGTLGINWKLFLAQLVNFGIVIFILWKWVMKPVVGALEARRARIEASVQKAEEIEQRMKQFEAEREQELREARREAEGVLQKALAAADSIKTETLESARAEAERILVETRTTIAADKEKMLRELREELSGLTLLATEKILRQKLDGHKDRELVAEVLKTLQ